MSESKKTRDRRDKRIPVKWILLGILFVCILFLYFRVVKKGSYAPAREAEVPEGRIVGVTDHSVLSLKDTDLIISDLEGEERRRVDLGRKPLSSVFHQMLYLSYPGGRLDIVDPEDGKPIVQKKLYYGSYLKETPKYLVAYGENRVNVLNYRGDFLFSYDFPMNLKEVYLPKNYEPDHSEKNRVYGILEEDGISGFVSFKGREKEMELFSSEETFREAHFMQDKGLLLSDDYLYFLKGESILKKMAVKPWKQSFFNGKVLFLVGETLQRYDMDGRLLGEEKAPEKAEYYLWNQALVALGPYSFAWSDEKTQLRQEGIEDVYQQGDNLYYRINETIRRLEF